jgi:transcriptional regulator with XRE-family HTH domain
MTTASTSDAQIDRLVKAGWLAIGLSQRDLADVLDAALSPASSSGEDYDRGSSERLREVAEALDVELDLHRAGANGKEATAPAQPARSLLSLLDLRLLRAFFQLQDRRTKLMLVHLAEQIVKRRVSRSGDAS